MMEVLDMSHAQNMERRKHRTETRVPDGGGGRNALTGCLNDGEKADNFTSCVKDEYERDICEDVENVVGMKTRRSN